MKTLTITTKSQAKKILLNSLFAPVNGATLYEEKYCSGKYARNMAGETINVSDDTHAVWMVRRTDSNGAYWQMRGLSARERVQA